MKKTFTFLIMFLTVATLSGQSPLTITVKGVSFKMISVQGGTFTMGCTLEQEGDCHEREKPAHKVTLSTYYIGETEVTRELWKAVMGDKGIALKVDRNDKCPVTYVTWNDCQEFIEKLNQLTGRKFRLPTEAEWEFAARGGKKSAGYKYSGSNNISAVAWNTEKFYEKDKNDPDFGLQVVKSKKPNELGIYDMSGNAREWCADWYGPYTDEAQTNPQGPSSGSYRLIRGGGWATYLTTCRCSARSNYSPTERKSDVGFRLVLIP